MGGRGPIALSSFVTPAAAAAAAVKDQFIRGGARREGRKNRKNKGGERKRSTYAKRALVPCTAASLSFLYKTFYSLPPFF